MIQISRLRFQDVHNQSLIMVQAAGRWLGLRLDLLTAFLIVTVVAGALLVSQDAGSYAWYFVVFIYIYAAIYTSNVEKPAYMTLNKLAEV